MSGGGSAARREAAALQPGEPRRLLPLGGPDPARSADRRL